MICATAISACGTGSQTAKNGATGGPLLKYAECMRAQRLSNFPDPSASGGLAIPDDINTNAPAFKSAQQACASLSQGSYSTGQTQSREAQLLALARCMRAHGVSSFSDPTTSPPPPSSGNVMGGNGWYLALGTARQRQSPAYKKAATACQLKLR